METIRFDDFIRLNRGFDLPDYKIEKGEYPVITSTNIKAFHKEYKVEGPMVVTGRSGSLGKVQYIERRCWPLNTSLYVKDYKGNFPRYVYYFLQMMHLEQYNAGAGVPTLNQNHLHSLKIKIHEKKLQQKIASILSAYDRLIENNTRRIRLLEQMAENLYKEWFVRFRFPEHENVEIVNGLPKGWEIKIIADFGRIETGKTPPMSNRDLYGGDILFVKTPDMHGKLFVRSTSETLSQEGNNYQRTKLLPINSIMVSCIGTAGIVSINTNLAHTNQQINSIILNNLEDLEWLYYVCRQLKPTIELFGATGATMTNLSKGKFEKLKIVVPKVDFRGAFHKRIRPYFKEIYALEQQNTFLTRQRDLLLPRLMSGKLEVKS